nr:aminoglycoside phosphotransferase family protein [uncultured Sphaerochaeta sp.]
MQISEHKLRQVINHFAIEGSLTSIEVNKEGHINSTFFTTFTNKGSVQKYTHQRINTLVFKQPEALMENVSLVTSHIRSKLIGHYDNVDQRCLRVIPTRSGANVYVDEDGGYWRTYQFIDYVKTFKTIADAEQAYLLGEAIGNFQLQLSDFDGNLLHETIPHFHDMRLRYEQLEEAIQVNHDDRIQMVGPEVEYLMDSKERGFMLWDKLQEGRLPVRVTHNDTKINNVLFSLDGKEALCIIDLDTVMPGTILFDTGDMIRTATTTAEEDATDLSTVHCDTSLHHALLAGYFSKADFLTPLERSLVVESGRNITQIMAVRFLTDFLNGDRYYHIDRENQNLERARNQIALMQDMDSKWQTLSQGV